MLKLGITDVAGLDRPRTIFGVPREVAVPVLWRALHEDPARYGAAVAEAFNRLRMGNGVYKYTAPRRFDDIAADVQAVLRERLGRGRLSAHDLGASDGTTSVELFRALATDWPDLRFVFSDWFDAVHVFRPKGGAWSGVLDAELRPIQFFGQGIVLTPMVPPRRWHPINRWLLGRLLRDFVPRLAAAVRASTRDGDRLIPPTGWSAERIPLVCRAALQLVSEDPRASFVRQSVLDPLPERVQFVRAMNVLNPGYFSAEDLRRAVARVKDALDEGGVFLIGRNIDEEDGRTTATAFVRTASGFEPVKRFQGGSEIESAVLA